MSRGVQNFRQGDVTKAIKGAERAGLKVRAEIAADGRTVLDFTQRAEKAARDTNEWDDVK